MCALILEFNEFLAKEKVKKYHKMLLIRPFKHDGKSKNIQRRAGLKKNVSQNLHVFFHNVWWILQDFFLRYLMKFGVFRDVCWSLWVFFSGIWQNLNFYFLQFFNKNHLFLQFFDKIHVFPHISFMILWWNRQFFNGWKIMGWDSLMEFPFLWQVF